MKFIGDLTVRLLYQEISVKFVITVEATKANQGDIYMSLRNNPYIQWCPSQNMISYQEMFV